MTNRAVDHCICFDVARLVLEDDGEDKRIEERMERERKEQAERKQYEKWRYEVWQHEHKKWQETQRLWQIAQNKFRDEEKMKQQQSGRIK